MKAKSKDDKQQRDGILERDGKLYARITYFGTDGKRKQKWKIAKNRTEAKALRKEMQRELEDNGPQSLESSRKTFDKLADHFDKHYLKPAQYHDGKKIAGRRSLSGLGAQLRALRACFGRRPLRSITYGDLEAFKVARLSEPTPGDIARHTRELMKNPDARLRSTRAIASVNRELALLRCMLNVALDEGWIKKSPFRRGLISVSDERKRERILTRDEESKLLIACDAHPRGRYLRPLVIAALDTGMRQGELFKLCWRDVDFGERLITVRAFNTKTMRERHVSITARLTLELEKLFAQSPKDPDASVFGIADNIHKSFTAVRRAAGLEDLRFHDLRHTAATRLVGLHIPLAEVGRVLGHTQPATTYRYVNANVETARRASSALDTFNAQSRAQGGEQVSASELVN
jgi:integrase